MNTVPPRVLTPVAEPEMAPIEAIVGSPLVQEPLPPSVNVTDEPEQTLVAPPIGEGRGLTTTGAKAKQPLPGIV
jgi:hypothetical protein